MPNPKNYSSKEEFMDVCIPMVQREGTAKDPKQAVAICHSMWARRNKKKK